MKQGERIAVVGAGLSGSLVAAQLYRQGAEVTVFDKSRGTGGRLSSARLGELSVDLGTPGLSPAQQEALAALLPDSALPELSRWQPVATDFDLQTLPAQTLWVPCPRSSGLTRALLHNIALKSRVRVAAIQSDPGTGLWLEDEAGTGLGRFDRVVVSIPAPQAVPLLQQAPQLQQAARRAEMMPCWILLLQLSHRPARLAEVDWLEGEHPVFRRVWRDSSKPGRTGETWFIEARSDWSRQHIGTDATDVQSRLLESFSALCQQVIEPEQARIHRWLYAHSDERPLSLCADEDARLLVCGDWAGGGGVDGAIQSVRRLHERLFG